MRLATVLPWLTILASGCVSARWSVATTSPRTVESIAVAPIELEGVADAKVAASRRAGLIETLLARGYEVREAAPGIPLLQIKLTGTGVSDSQMHAPSDPTHHLGNDLHYYFVAYHVDVELHDGQGALIAMGSASSNQDPAPALRVLATHLFTDVPPRYPQTVASR